MEGERGLVVDAPEAAVAVALGNLIGNAVKYTPKAKSSCACGRRSVEVIDSGPGLSAEDAAQAVRARLSRHARRAFAGRRHRLVDRAPPVRAVRLGRARACRASERGVVATLRASATRAVSDVAAARSVTPAGGVSRHRRIARHRLQPAVLVRRLAVEQAEEQLLHAARHRPGLAGADLAAVDRTDRRDFRRGAAHEELVAQVQVFARQVALDHFDAGVARQA